MPDAPQNAPDGPPDPCPDLWADEPGVTPPPVPPLDVEPPARDEIDRLGGLDRDELKAELRPTLDALGVVGNLAVIRRQAGRVAVLRELVELQQAAADAGLGDQDPQYTVGKHAAYLGYVSLFAHDTTDASCSAAYAIHAAAQAADEFSAGAGPPVLAAALLDVRRVARLREVSGPEADVRWDDPRLGPLWAGGTPEWHRRAEGRVRQLKARLTAGRVPPGPPPPLTVAQLANYRKLDEMAARGELARYRGEYVVVLGGEVAHGPVADEVLQRVAERLGEAAGSAAVRYVY